MHSLTRLCGRHGRKIKQRKISLSNATLAFQNRTFSFSLSFLTFLAYFLVFNNSSSLLTLIRDS